MRRFLIPVLVLIGVIVLAGLLLFFLTGGPQSSSSTIYTVKTGTISAVVRTTGKIEPARNSKLSFKTGDTIKKIYVKPGDKVPSGLLLAELDDSRLQRELAQAEAQREITRLTLSGAQERSRYQAATAPTPTGGPPSSPTLPPNFTPSASPPPIPPVSDQYVAAKQAEQAELVVQQARANLESARLYAPYDGTVLTIDASEGDAVGGGSPVLTFADLNILLVRADVDEIDVANVTIGQKVQFTLDAFPGKDFEGRINAVAPSATQRQGSTVYSALVNFSKPPVVLVRPGMAASLTITSFTKNDILVVPTRALKTIGSRKYASRYLSESRTEDIPVETGLTGGDLTEIASGLKEGDRIAVPR